MTKVNYNNKKEEAEMSLLVGTKFSMRSDSNNNDNIMHDVVITTQQHAQETKGIKSDDEVMNNHWWAILFGQGIALSSASTNTTSYVMVNDLGIVFPIFQTGLAYAILSMHLLFPSCSKLKSQGQLTLQNGNGNQDEEQENLNSDDNVYKLPFTNFHLRMSWWTYFMIAFLDVQANFFIILSFRYTSLTNTTLLLSLTTPATMIISRYILSRTFSFHHFAGVFLCLLGGTMTVWNDIDTDTTTVNTNTHSFIGDLFAIAGAISFGLTDTVAEYSVKHVDRKEYLGMLGFFGAIISFIQSPIIGEWEVLVNLCTKMSWDVQLQVMVTLIWFIASVITYYIAASYFLLKSDATLLNLSLQAAQFWAISFTVFAESVVPPPIFFVATVFVILGVFIYEIEPFHIMNYFKVGQKTGNKTSDAGDRELRTSSPQFEYGSLETSSIDSAESIM